MRFISKLVDFAEAYELPASLGLVLALVGVVITPASKLSFILAAFIGLACILIGLLTAALIRRKRFPLVCKSCKKAYEIALPTEGQISVIRETQLLHAKVRLETVVLSLRFFDGEVIDETITYRNLGKHGKDSAAIPHVLGAGQIHIQSTDTEQSIIRIVLPGFAARHDDLEFVWLCTTRNSFRNTDEAVGKPILFPTGELSFELVFPSESVGNVGMTRYVDRVPEDFVAIQPTVDSGRCVVAWNGKEARPNENYGVSWRWLAAV